VPLAAAFLLALVEMSVILGDSETLSRGNDKLGIGVYILFGRIAAGIFIWHG
jgi:hypothetical protein